MSKKPWRFSVELNELTNPILGMTEQEAGAWYIRFVQGLSCGSSELCLDPTAKAILQRVETFQAKQSKNGSKGGRPKLKAIK